MFNFSGNDTERPKVSSVNEIKPQSGTYNQPSTPDISDSIQNKMNQLNNREKGSNFNLSKVSGYAGAAAGLANSFMNDDDLVPDGQLESTTRAVETIDSVKDAVGKAIPIAGMFREVEKLGIKAGKAIDGDKGQMIAEGYFSPIQTIGKLNADDDLSQGEKMFGSFATLALPFGGTISGSLLHKANQKRAKRFKEINKFKKETAEEIEIKNKKQLEALNRLRTLKEAQLNYIPRTRYS